MKAFNTYGSRCNGCNEYAEFCGCDVSSDGELVRSYEPSPNNDIDYPDSGEYGYDDE